MSKITERWDNIIDDIDAKYFGTSANIEQRLNISETSVLEYIRHVSAEIQSHAWERMYDQGELYRRF